MTIIPATDILYLDETVEEVIDQIETLSEQCIGQLDTFKQEELKDHLAIEFENLRMHDTTFSMYKFLPYLIKTNSIIDYSNGITLLSPYTGILDNYKLYVEEMFYYNKELFEGRKIDFKFKFIL